MKSVYNPGVKGFKSPAHNQYQQMRRPGFSQPVIPPSIESIKRKKTIGTSYYVYILLKQGWPLLILLPLVIFIGVFIFRDSLIPAVNLAIAKSDTKEKSVTTPAEVAVPRKGQLAKSYESFAPSYGYVMFESYRTGAKTFSVLGLSGVVFRNSKKLGSCLWKETGGGHRTRGKIHVFYPGEHHDLKYEVIILACELQESTEHDTGGRLLMQLDGEEIVVYEEASGTFPIAEPRSSYKYRLALCSTPVVSPLNPQRLYEWIEFHLRQGVEFLTVYDAGGVEEDSAALLEKYKAKGLAEVVNLRKIDEFETWASGQVLGANDCAYRNRYKAKWALVLEINEYFSSESGITLASLLDTFPGKPYVTLGSRWWSVEKCLPDESNSLWAVQRLVYHWPHIYCTGKEKFPRWELCLDYYGFRRFAVDPRQVTALQIHRPEVPQTGGADVDTDVARLNRFQALAERRSKFCSYVVQSSEVVDWWVYDKALDPLASEAKKSPVVAYKAKN